ncbi:MAG: PIN domain protein [Thermodesulfobacteriota bacterium]
MRIYMDVCSFNRPFDDQTQIRIRLEAEAKLRIQEEIRSGRLQLVWSYILDYENTRNPYQERRVRISGWKDHAILDVHESAQLLDKANALHKEGIARIDCLHIACAIAAECDYFLTTDDRILRCSNRVSAIKIVDPILFLKECDL